SKEVQSQLERLFTDAAPDTEELEPLYRDIIEASATHFIVIDGIDECPKADRDTIFAVLRRLKDSSKSIIKIFLSSREDVGWEIQRTFNYFQHRTTDCHEVDTDIRSYV